MADEAPGAPMTLLAALLALALSTPVLAQPIRTDEYRVAAAAGRLGTVSGRAFEEPRARRGAETPLAGFGVTLLPRSDAFLARLARLRDDAREDLKAYRTSARLLVDARRDYERALADAGAADLARYTVVEPDGTFRFESVPAGAWIVVGLRPVFVGKDAGPPRPKEKETFARQPRLVGYHAVSVWIREVDVVPAGVASVTLTDRNVWMTAIEEKRVLDAGP